MQKDASLLGVMLPPAFRRRVELAARAAGDDTLSAFARRALSREIDDVLGQVADEVCDDGMQDGPDDG